MTTALTLHNPYLETLFNAALLCEVCQERHWTQTARWCEALICADCALGEPDEDDFGN
jgi:hypothetical protein